jgi:formamidopyrimidine-DNA glycosylase
MPELPEVETVVQSLRQPLLWRTITGVIVQWPRTIAYPSIDRFTQDIVGRSVASVRRRGKYIIIDLDRGHLLIHLKMSGGLQVMSKDQVCNKHTRVLLDLDDGQQLRFHDTRKFGRMYLVDDPEQVTASLGPEPLAPDFSSADFSRLFGRRSGRIKSLLLNQTFLAGLGNIYADEALFASHIHPWRTADSLNSEERARLYGAIRQVLSSAVAGRGTTLDDRAYTDAEGRAGSYQEWIAVYGRTGEPCLRCQTPIERMVIGGRSSHYCPQCQPVQPE